MTFRKSAAVFVICLVLCSQMALDITVLTRKHCGYCFNKTNYRGNLRSFSDYSIELGKSLHKLVDDTSEPCYVRLVGFIWIKIRVLTTFERVATPMMHVAATQRRQVHAVVFERD